MIRSSLACAILALSATAFAEPVEWTFPRMDSCHEGLAFGGASAGVLVWGGGDEIRLTVGRSDLWDHRGGYPWTESQSYTNIVAAVRSGDKDRLYGLFKKETPAGEPRNPYMLPLGRVVVKVPGKTLKRGSLDPFTGIGELEFEDGGKVKLAMDRWCDGIFAMKFDAGTGFEVSAIPATDFPVYEKDLKKLGFAKASEQTTCELYGGFTWKLPADKPVDLRWRRVSLDVSGTPELVITTSRNSSGLLVYGGPPPCYKLVASGSREYWAKFWAEGARVKVPDPAIQRIFDYGMYRFGAMTDPDCHNPVPAGLQGVWLEDDMLVPWNGDYHFNINVQECYSPAYRGGHFKHLLPLFKMVLSWRPLLKDNARKFVGIDNGYVLPHSVDDRGVCIGGFWTGTIDHGSTAWVASMMMKYVRYSGDVAFLKDGAFDYMKGAMNVYRAMMEETPDGKLSIPLGPSPEWGGSDVKSAVGRDPSFQLAAAHRLARDLADAAKLLGEEPDAMWLDVEKRLPQCSAGESGVELFKGQPLTASHRHHSHMAGFYPFDTIDMSGGAKLAETTYATWKSRGTNAWTGWCVPWASILHTHIGDAESAVKALKDWDEYFCDAGHGSHHDAVKPGFTSFMGRPHVMQMDGQCAAATAVMELMVHEVNGKVEFFRGCPESWREVSFENIALSDGRRVSGKRVDGKVSVVYSDGPAKEQASR